MENLPAPQTVHSDEPAVANLPAKQPPLHDETVRPVVDPYWPALHPEHTIDCTLDANRPTAQLMQLAFPVSG
jgi:hypothetical protein